MVCDNDHITNRVLVGLYKRRNGTMCLSYLGGGGVEYFNTLDAVFVEIAQEQIL